MACEAIQERGRRIHPSFVVLNVIGHGRTRLIWLRRLATYGTIRKWFGLYTCEGDRSTLSDSSGTDQLSAIPPAPIRQDDTYAISNVRPEANY